MSKQPDSKFTNRGGGVPSRDALYRKVAGHAEEAIATIVDVMSDGGGRMGSLRLGAAKIILNKVLPDIKATELTGKDGEQLTVRLISDYLSKPLSNATSVGSVEGPSKVQDTDMASKSKKD